MHKTINSKIKLTYIYIIDKIMYNDIRHHKECCKLKKTVFFISGLEPFRR